MNIREEIFEKRAVRISREGAALGHTVPGERISPLMPFDRQPLLICEIKRSSPSKGNFSPDLDAVAQAGRYVQSGAQTVSVLTEENYFHGSLQDLMDVKNAFPFLSVLRKDFLDTEEDLLLSYRAGADAVLLIASHFPALRLKQLYDYAMSLGLAVLFEVHDLEDAKKASFVRPQITGYNCRDLSTFQIDLLSPVKLLSATVYPGLKVFESGIHSQEHALYALSNGFDGLLVGESVVKTPTLVTSLIEAFYLPKASGFWKKLFAKPLNGDRPLVKVCGITRKADAELACELGADALGFVFAKSPRRAKMDLLSQLKEISTPKIAVLVPEEGEFPEELKTALEKGLIDAIQFHGATLPRACPPGVPHFQAISPRFRDDLDVVSSFSCPRFLLDAFSAQAVGGTGLPLADDILSKASQMGPLWMAGGLGPGTVGPAIRKWKPELIDASSKLESEPGIKDAHKLKAFFKEIADAVH